MIIVVIGLPGSGKSTVGKMLAEHWPGAWFEKSSSFIKQMLDVLDLPDARENYQKLVTALRELYGDDVLVPAALDAMQPYLNSGKVVVVDGIRKQKELASLVAGRAKFVVFVEASAEQRYKLLRERKEKANETVMSWEQFQKEDVAASEKDIESFRHVADAVLVNDGSLADMQKNILALVPKIEAAMSNKK